MRAWRICVEAAVLLGLAASPCPAADATIRLASGEWLPWFSQRSPGGGPASQAISEALALAGWRVEYEYMPWPRALELARSSACSLPAAGGPHIEDTPQTSPEACRGALDFHGTVGWSQSPDREVDFLASAPVFHGYDVFFFRRDRTFDWTGDVSQLAGRRVGTTLSYFYGDAFERFAAAATAAIDVAPTDLLNMTKLLMGRIDLFGLDWRVGIDMLSREFSPAEAASLACHPVPLRVAAYRVLLSRRWSDAEKARSDLDSGLAQLAASGRLTELLAPAEDLRLPDGYALPCEPVRVE